MAYDRYGQDDGRSDDYRRWDREDYGASSAREYRAAGELGGYGRDSQRGGNDRDYGSRDFGQRGFSDRDGQREFGRQDYGRQDYGQRDYSSSRYGQDDRARGDQGGWGGERDRQRFGGWEGGRDQERQSYGRDTYRQSRGTFDRQPQNHGRDDDRGFMDRAADEVRSWFGDEEAERRRARDAGETGGSYGRDEHYHSWRNQQIQAFDRDYDEYRRENQSKFHSEFASFRSERQSQRDLLNKVDEHMEVLGSDGQHVGTVDKVRGDRIILTKNDQDAGGRHHSIPSRWLQSVEGGKLMLRKSADEAKQHWRDEERQQSESSAMFRGDDSRQSNEGGFGRSNEDGSSTGRTNLNRSFSGTY